MRKVCTLVQPMRRYAFTNDVPTSVPSAASCRGVPCMALHTHIAGAPFMTAGPMNPGTVLEGLRRRGGGGGAPGLGTFSATWVLSPRSTSARTPSKAASMPGSDHSGAWAGCGSGRSRRTPPARRPRGRRPQLPRVDPVGDDPGQLADEVVDVRADHLPRLAGEPRGRWRTARGHRAPAALGGDQEVEPAAQALEGGRSSAAAPASGAEMRASQRSATASRSAALLGKWR